MGFDLASFILAVLLFAAGWFVRGLTMKTVEVPILTTLQWRCPKCERVKVLPAELEAKVLLCNNCNVKLAKVEA